MIAPRSLSVRNILVALLTLLLVQLVNGEPVQDIEKLELAYRDRSASAFWAGDFDEIEKLYRGADVPEALAFTPNKRMQLVRYGLVDVFRGHDDASDRYFAELDRLTLQWAVANPKSALALTMHARALYARAWALRGNGFANEVEPQSWAGFQKYLKEAYIFLNERADVAFKDGTAYVYTVMIAKSLGLDSKDIWKIAEQGLKVNPLEDALYSEALYSFLPKWGGNVDSLDEFISNSLVNTRADRGMEMYAVLYALAAESQYRGGIFRETHANWEKMKAGYKDLLKREPRSLHRNRFAYFSCLARDKSTFVEQLNEIPNDKIDIKNWGANGASTLSECKKWAAEP